MSVLHGTGQRRFLCLPDRPASQQGPPTRELVLTSTVDPPGSATWRLTAEVRLRLLGPLTVHSNDAGSLPAGACDSLTALTAVRAMLTFVLEGPWPALFDSSNPRGSRFAAPSTALCLRIEPLDIAYLTTGAFPPPTRGPLSAITSEIRGLWRRVRARWRSGIRVLSSAT